MKIKHLLLLFVPLLAANIFAQETGLLLPTNDNTSYFNIMKQNGTSVFKVDGNGQMSGDGSGLSYVKPVAAYVQGNQSVYFHEGMIAGLNLYEAQKMRELTISCPGPGIIFAIASGYCDWESVDIDLVRIWFYPHPTVSPTTSWETPDFHNLRIVSDYGCTDSSDEYTSWSITKTYTVNSAQNYTVSVCADKPFTSSKVLIGDVSLQLLFIPTGGTGSASLVSASLPAESSPEIFPANVGIDGSPVSNTLEEKVKPQNLKSNSDKDRISALENEIKELKEKLDSLLEKKK